MNHFGGLFRFWRDLVIVDESLQCISILELKNPQIARTPAIIYGFKRDPFGECQTLSEGLAHLSSESGRLNSVNKRIFIPPSGGERSLPYITTTKRLSVHTLQFQWNLDFILQTLTDTAAITSRDCNFLRARDQQFFAQRRTTKANARTKTRKRPVN